MPRAKRYYELEFIVSSGLHCLLDAQFFVRVADRRVLDWIHKITGCPSRWRRKPIGKVYKAFPCFLFACFLDTRPMLMVVGGYTDQNPPNFLTHDVEILSPTPDNTCSKRVQPLPGQWFNFTTHLETNAALLGLTGKVPARMEVQFISVNLFLLWLAMYIGHPRLYKGLWREKWRRQP